MWDEEAVYSRTARRIAGARLHEEDVDESEHSIYSRYKTGSERSSER